MTKKLIVVILLSLLIRVVLAKFFLQSFDQEAWEKIATLVLQGKNPYVETTGIYSFSPLWMSIISILKILHVAYVAPIILADIVIIYLLYRETKKVWPALFYGLNPISIYVTSLDGNFDPLMVVFLLLSYLFYKDSNKIFAIIFFSIAILFKQAALLIFPAFIMQEKTMRDKVVFTVFAIFPFIVSLTHFFLLNPSSILRNVIFYHPGGGWWGYDVVFRKVWMGGAIFLEQNVTIIVAGLVAWYFYMRKKRKLLNDIILLLSGFYFLKSVGGAQYLLWILPFAILSGEQIMYAYTGFSSFYLIVGFLQSTYLPGIPGVGFFSLPAWITSGVWFARKIRQT